MPDLQVDLDGLSRLADRLRSVCSALEGAERVLRGHDAALGHPAVVSALHRFEDRWRDGREKITDNAKTLGTMASTSVATYRKADSDLAASLPASSP